MLLARLICSESDCPEAFEARARTLAELESLACDCGCSLQVLWVDADSGAEAELELEPLAA